MKTALTIALAIAAAALWSVFAERDVVPGRRLVEMIGRYVSIIGPGAAFLPKQ